MKTKIIKYIDESPIDSLVMREKLGLKRYRKMAKRAAEKKNILMRLALKKMEEKEKVEFIPLGFRRRRVIIG